MDSVVSFGFRDKLKLGNVSIYDARGFRNPHSQAELRELNGLDAGVSKYVLSSPGVEEFIVRIIKYNDKHAAIGCYGGKHRSVAIATEIARRTGAQCTHLSLVREI